jgi:uncharacterized protein
VESDETAGGRYEGLKFGDPDATIYLDERSVLVRPDVARRQIEEDERKRGRGPGGDSTSGGGQGRGNGGRGGGTGGTGGSITTPEPPVVLPRRFYGVVEVDPVRLGGSAGQISQEIVQHLASIMGADVEITVEIRAEVPEGIPADVEHIVSENCRTLKFRDFGFERK